MRRHHVESELLYQPGETRRLPFWQFEHEPGQRCGVDDRMLQRAFEPPSNQPGVEGVVAVLDENCAVGESKKRPAGVAELRCSDQHRTIDVVPLFGVGVDRGPAVDEGVEEGERPRKLESLRAKFEDEERRVTSRFHVDGDELCIVKERLRAQLRGIDRDLLPWNRLCGPSWLEKDWFRIHRDWAMALRAKRISSALIALRSSTATA
jgi:hypothetical protein